MADKIDSNVTGLRFAEEESLKQLPTVPVWYPLEPNSYNDFGSQIQTIARQPIDHTRQRKKGVVTDIDASGGFNQDLTFDNTTRLLQGFFFADARERLNNHSLLNDDVIQFTSVDEASSTYTLAAPYTTGDVLPAGALVKFSGFGDGENNGLKTVVSATDTTITVSETLVDDPQPPVDNVLFDWCGFQFADGAAIFTGGRLYISGYSESNPLPFTLIPGEWIYVGGDDPASRFDNNDSNGFMRVKEISYVAAGARIWFDKSDKTLNNDSGAGKKLQIFFGTVIKNEDEYDKIKRRTYHVERTLGYDADGVMSEYLIGAVPNEMNISINQADKITIDLSFVACDNEQRTGAQGMKNGRRVSLLPSDCYNTSSDFSRIRLAQVTPNNPAPAPMFAFATEMSLNINNNVSPNKAIGVLGAFDTTAGMFEVGGSLTAYFASIPAVQAVRDNADVTIDIAMVKQNRGLLWDIPLLSLGDGRLNVEQDQAITLPLETNAAECEYRHTLLVDVFPYLPSVAE